MLWTKKYIPKNSKEIVGNDANIKKIINFISNYKKQKKKAVLLYGPSGVGKTCSAYAIADEYDTELLELNSSDFRDTNKIKQIIGGAANQMSLFSKSKIIFIDEIDGFSGVKDRGGITALTQIMKKSSFPIILTADDPWNKKFSSLRKQCLMIEMGKLNYSDIFGVIKNIADKENIKYDINALKKLARYSGGDLRAAIVDLQSSVQNNKFEKKNLDKINFRYPNEKIFDVLVRLFKTTDAKVAYDSLSNLDDLKDVALWIEENIPKEYKKPKDIYRAFEALASSDRFYGRIRKQQYWRYFVYYLIMMSSGVALAKDEKYHGLTQYKRTERPLKIWMANMRNAAKRSIIQKLADTLSISKRKTYTILNEIKFIYQHDKIFKEKINELLELDNKEIAWLEKKS